MFNFPSFFDNGSFRTPRSSSFGFDDPFWNPVRTQTRRTPQKQSMYRPRTQAYEPVYHDVMCNGCREYPIEGTRYECSVCPDFDFCEHCWKTVRHPHSFYKIETPEERSRPSMRKSTPKEEPRRPQKETYTKRKDVFDDKENLRPEPQVKQEPKRPEFKTVKPRVQPEAQTLTQTKQKQFKNVFPNKANMVIIRDETNNKVVDVIYC